MLRTLTLALAACTLACAPARAQAVPADSLLHIARADADQAAREASVGSYYVGGFFGGTIVGLMAPIAVLSPTKEAVGLAGAGGALLFATFDQAGRPVRTLPDTTEWRVADQPPDYQQAFRAEYGQRLARRRVRAAQTGGIIGTLTGVGFFGFLVYSFANADS
jgi:hypothetical protein